MKNPWPARMLAGVLCLFALSIIMGCRTPLYLEELEGQYFVEVRDRGPGNHSVILYEVVKGKIQVVDAVRVTSDFTKDPPIIRYTRIRDIKEQ